MPLETALELEKTITLSEVPHFGMQDRKSTHCSDIDSYLKRLLFFYQKEKYYTNIVLYGFRQIELYA